MRFSISTILLSLLLSLFFSVGVVNAATIGKSLSNQSSLNSGLVGWWTFDGADVNATQVKDKVGTNHGTRNGGLAVVSGKISQAGKFDGVDDTVSTTAVTLAGNTRTISTWVKFKNFNLLDRIVGRAADMYLTYNFTDVVCGTANRLNFIIYQAPTWYCVNSSSQPSLNTWYHLVGTNDASGMKLYINGVLVDSNTSNLTLTTNSIAFDIGGVTADRYNGLLDDIRYYTRALSAKEIKMLYQMGGGKIAQTPSNTPNLNNGLINWWTFDGADSGVISSVRYVTDKIGGQTATSTAAANNPLVYYGKIGQGLKFDGVNDYLHAGISVLSGNTGAFSVSGWFKSGYFGGSQTLFGKDDRAVGIDNKMFQVQTTVGGESISGSTIAGYVWDDSATAYLGASYTGTITNNIWHLVTFTYNGGTAQNSVQLYIDGIAGSGTYSGGSFQGIDDTAGNFVVGSYRASGGSYARFLNGSMDDIRVYNRALTAKEIKMLYQEGSGNKVAQTPPNTPNLNSGLVGWWTFDGADCGAAYCVDKSGGGYVASSTAAGRPKKVSGKTGQAFQFDGIDDLFAFTGGSDLPSTSRSITAWVKIKNTATVNQLIAGKVATNFLSYGFNSAGCSTSNFNMPIRHNGSSWVCANGVTTISANKWYFVVGTYDGTNVSLYLNGVLEGGPIAATLADTTYPVIDIGALTGFGGFFLGGTIDDVRAYNRVLSAKEIKMLYQMGR